MEILELRAKYGNLLDVQLEMEDTFKREAEESLRLAIERATSEEQAATIPVGQKLVSYGMDDVMASVSEWLNHWLAPKRGVKPGYVSILKQMVEVFGDDVERVTELLSAVPLLFMLNSSMSEHRFVDAIALQVVQEIYEEVRLQAFINDLPEDILKAVENGLDDRTDRRYKAAYARRCMTNQGWEWEEWPVETRTLLGHQLIELVVQSSGFFDVTTKDPETGSDCATMFIPSEWLMETWQANTDRLLERCIRNCPTVIPPQDWSDLYNGGYYGVLAGRHALLRQPYSSLKVDRANKERLKQADLSKIYKVINTIQRTPWRINTRVMDALDYIIDKGGNSAGVPGMDKLPRPQNLQGEYTEEELKEHKKKLAIIHKEDMSRSSKALRTKTQLLTAKRFSKFERIYFPYNMDFRGRVYPIPSFSPQADDIGKALLEFADVPPIQSEEDLDWLMIHGANCAGVDKVSFEERIAWVKANEEAILECGLDPKGTTFWRNEDFDCFQFLAFCIAWADLRKYQESNGTPIGHYCHLALAFDGTCSGLQHYSAILRDSIGAKAVNLLPGDKPNDIYGQVAQGVNEILKIDALNGTTDEDVEYDDGKQGIKYGTQTLAQLWLSYGVNRKVTKRSVMTLAYGSKEYGFKQQILEDTIVPDMNKNKEGSLFTKETKNQAASYLAKLIWKTVQSTVVSAVDGMKYLQQITRLVVNSDHVVSWTTPMGLPLQQSYTVREQSVIRLRLSGNVRRTSYQTQRTELIDKSAQVSGIAPNFIHSMDACHLQMTVLEANSGGINHFALIHDSFGCPAPQAGILNKSIRQAFYDLYTEFDPLETFHRDLACYFPDDLKPEELPVRPEAGDLDLSIIFQSKYMFA